MLLALESELDADRYAFGESAIPMWSYVRWPLARMLFRAVFPSEAAVGGGAARSLSQRARFAANTVRDARWPRGPRPIALVSTTVSCVLREGRYFNRLVEHFAEARAADSLIVEESADDRRRAPRSFSAVASLDALSTWAAIEARATRVRSRDAAAIDALLAQITSALPLIRTADIAALRATLEGVARRLPALRRGFDWFAARAQPRLLIVEGASYGAFAHFMLWARDRAIVTAEHQHGLISPNHEAYNFSDAVVGTRFQDTLPEHFLAYGPAWMRGVRLPSRAHMIGNPDLSVAIDQLRREPPRGESPRALFISSAMDPARYERVIARMSAALQPLGGTVVLRPHPIERGVAAERYRSALAQRNVELDAEPSLHRSIADASVVVGDFSTSLFEALAIGRPTAVLDGAQSRQHVDGDAMTFVRDEEEAAQFALDAARSANAVDRASPSAYWAQGWRASYRTFTDRALEARLLFAR